jgi:hypothetical protein
MPQVVAAVVAVFSAAAAWFGSSAIGAFIGKLALNFAISSLVGKLFKPAGLDTADSVKNRQFVVRSSIQPRNIVYGYAVTSGPLVFVHNSDNKKYVYLVIALAGHEVEDIPVVYFNETPIFANQIDGSGNVIDGDYDGYARIKKYYGTSTQTADTDLISASGGLWTSSHRLQGVAYLSIRLRHSFDVYAAGLPNIKAMVKGKKVLDTRDSVVRWTDNPALIVRDYITNSLGLGASTSEINSTVCSAAANICDERVTVVQSGVTVTFNTSSDEVNVGKDALRFGNFDGVRFTTSGTLPSPLAINTTYYVIREASEALRVATSVANARAGIYIDLTTAGSGTHQMVHWDQIRYTANGVISTDSSPRDNVTSLLASMAGSMPYVQGMYEIRAGAYDSPTLALTEDDLRAQMSVQTRTPRKELYNAIKGVYVEPWRNSQPTDFTPVTNAIYEAQDGSVRIYRDIDLVFTTNQIMAQRIGKIHLEKSRQGITVSFPAKLRALETKAWATVTLSIAHLGWNSKVFRVIGWSLSPDGGVDLTLQEESSGSYDWNSGEATIVDGAPDTEFPSLNQVDPPSSLILDSGSDQAFVNQDGTVIVRVYAEWTASDDAFLMNYDFQWKLSTDTEWQSTTLSTGATTAYIEPAIEGSTYDVRIRAINYLGAASTFITGSVVATGKDTAPGDPSALATASAPEAIRLTWTNPVDKDLSYIEVWEASTNDRSGATKIADIFSDFFTRTGLTASAVRYYWIRAVDTSGNQSGYHPTSSTGGVSGTAGAVSIDYDDVTGTKPPSDANNTENAIDAGTTVTSGGLTFSAGGAIKGGQTDYNTGNGWFLGYSSGQYKFSIGDPSGNFFTWDGTTMSIKGEVDDLRNYTSGSKILGFSNTSAKSTNSTTLVDYDDINSNDITFQIDRDGTVNVGASCRMNAAVNNGRIRWYVNGVAATSEITVSGTAQAWYNIDISVLKGDLITLKMRSTSASYTITVSAMRISVDNIYPALFVTAAL